uniref:Kunitz/Bovine pancreatic trypsin inhibitor domain protein n=1 Tax=Haemonchus contortus TaxID=6289 RepID=A0A7I5EBW7_HAECO
MLPRWLLVPFIINIAAADDGGFVSAMKSLLFGTEQHNTSNNAHLEMHPSPSASGSPVFHQFAVAQQQASGQACMMPQQIGTGPYRIPRWYFNPARGRCELFYWSGCCGNGNNFQTFQSCQSACEESPNPCAVTVSIPGGQCTPGVSSCGGGSFCHVGANAQTTTCCPKPAPIDRCQQPLNVGIGNAQLQRWYFNPLTQQCQPCIYRGLQGNENNFLSKQDCENSCLVNACKIGSPYRSQGVIVQCSATNPTVCPAGHYCHVGADTTTSVCCQALGGDPCSQPMDRGVGMAQLQRWYWNGQSQTCVQFSYCGMKGTQNNFLSKQDCERTCYVLDNPCALGPPQMGLDNRPITCSVGMNTCGASFWCHFGANQQTTVCCPGRVEGQAVCRQPLALGTGEAALPRWYYDASTMRCVQFFYKGRYGNQNNFLSQHDCEQTCPVYVNVCPVGSPLLDSSNHPVPCTFGANSCGADHWCHLGLVPDEYQCCPGEPTVPGACQGMPEEHGELGAPAPPATRYYYDPAEMVCKPFIYNGRKGNQNNFLTLEDCEQTCNVFVNPCNKPISLPPQLCNPGGPDMCGPNAWCHVGASPDTTLCCPSEGDPCSLPLLLGEGNQFMDRWYYNQQSGSCQPFTYGGLHGNQNNFLTKEACDERCGPNPCFEGRPFVGVDGRPQTCSISANLNTCPANYWCHIGVDMSTTVCCPGASINVCNLPMSTGEGNYNLERYYFDQSTKTCRPFIYNGLKGNQNNFITLRACQLSCQPLDNPCIGQPATTAAGQVLFCSSTNKDTCPVNFWCHLGATPETTVCCPGATNPCSVPLAPGTGNAGLARWYYNPDDRQCFPFQYNGKRGNQNNFETQAECERTCPEELCLLSIDRGACGGRQTRYAFNRQTSQCVPFDYTGCGGNLNNFVSMMDCMATCGNVGFRR